MKNKPKIVTLCGSTRYLDVFREKAKDLTLSGHIVLSVELITTSERNIQNQNRLIKAKLDVLHFRKIDISDEVLILNVGGYIGESTEREIEYAKSIGIKIKYLEEE